MKSFSFSIPPAQTPKSTGSASGVSRNLFASNEDVAIVYETQVTSEQREAALRLQLPPNFYSYLNAPKCPGCVGCSDDDEEVITLFYHFNKVREYLSLKKLLFSGC